MQVKTGLSPICELSGDTVETLPDRATPISELEVYTGTGFQSNPRPFSHPLHPFAPAPVTFVIHIHPF